MARGHAVYDASVEGAGRASRRLDRAAAELPGVVRDEMRLLQPEIEAIFVDSAPYDYDERDDTHLAEELEVDVSKGGRIRLVVNSPVRDPKSGYPYTGVTRFGHRGVLRPKKAARLRWRDAAGWHSAEQTAGYHPASDWVEGAAIEADREVERSADRLGRTIATRIL